jgi:hypothetical protein
MDDLMAQFEAEIGEVETDAVAAAADTNAAAATTTTTTTTTTTATTTSAEAKPLMSAAQQVLAADTAFANAKKGIAAAGTRVKRVMTKAEKIARMRRKKAAAAAAAGGAIAGPATGPATGPAKSSTTVAASVHTTTTVKEKALAAAAAAKWEAPKPAAPVYNVHGQLVAAPAKEKKKFIRAAAGEVWEDKTLGDWPEHDFRLFVGNLGKEVTDKILMRAFDKYPSFAMARIVVNKRLEKSQGYGFVSFLDPHQVGAAIEYSRISVASVNQSVLPSPLPLLQITFTFQSRSLRLLVFLTITLLSLQLPPLGCESAA